MSGSLDIAWQSDKVYALPSLRIVERRSVIFFLLLVSRGNTLDLKIMTGSKIEAYNRGGREYNPYCLMSVLLLATTCSAAVLMELATSQL